MAPRFREVSTWLLFSKTAPLYRSLYRRRADGSQNTWEFHATFGWTHVQWQCEVSVEACEEDEECRDEVVDGGGARVRRQRDRYKVDHGHDGPTQILQSDHISHFFCSVFKESSY